MVCLIQSLSSFHKVLEWVLTMTLHSSSDIVVVNPPALLLKDLYWLRCYLDHVHLLSTSQSEVLNASFGTHSGLGTTELGLFIFWFFCLLVLFFPQILRSPTAHEVHVHEILSSVQFTSSISLLCTVLSTMLNLWLMPYAPKCPGWIPSSVVSLKLSITVKLERQLSCQVGWNPARIGHLIVISETLSSSTEWPAQATSLSCMGPAFHPVCSTFPCSVLFALVAIQPQKAVPNHPDCDTLCRSQFLSTGCRHHVRVNLDDGSPIAERSTYTYRLTFWHIINTFLLLAGGNLWEEKSTP